MPPLPKPRPHAIDRRARAAADQHALRAWSRAVRDRDGYRCRVCGGTYGVQAHHIVSRRVKRLRYDVSNGLTACATCHDDIHARLVHVWTVGDEVHIERVA